MLVIWNQRIGLQIRREQNNTMCGNYLGQLLDYLAGDDVYIGWAGQSSSTPIFCTQCTC